MMIKKTDGTMTTCEEEMLEMAMRYYIQLLNVCKEEQIDQDAFKIILNRMLRKVVSQMMG